MATHAVYDVNLEFVPANRIVLQSSFQSVCNEGGIWLHKTSLPKTCMLSCLPESCCSACIKLVVSGSNVLSLLLVIMHHKCS